MCAVSTTGAGVADSCSAWCTCRAAAATAAVVVPPVDTFAALLCLNIVAVPAETSVWFHVVGWMFFLLLFFPSCWEDEGGEAPLPLICSKVECPHPLTRRTGAVEAPPWCAIILPVLLPRPAVAPAARCSCGCDCDATNAPVPFA